MKSIPLFALASLLLVKHCQCSEEKANGFSCPEKSENSLMTTVVSGCKVYYTCENGEVTKIFQCSENLPLEGNTHACVENPQCLRINFLEEFKNLPNIVQRLNVKPRAIIEKSNSSCNASIDAFVRFLKCVVDVKNIEDFSKTCLDSILFKNKDFLYIEIPPNVFEVYSNLINKSSNTGDKLNNILGKSVGKVFKAFITYLASDCDMVCKGISKLDPITEDAPTSTEGQDAGDSMQTTEGYSKEQVEKLIKLDYSTDDSPTTTESRSTLDSKQTTEGYSNEQVEKLIKLDYSTEDAPTTTESQSTVDAKPITEEFSNDQVASGDRVKRSPPRNSFGLLNVLMNPRRQIQTPIPMYDARPTRVPETKSKTEVNSTLMSNVIVPIMKDIVNDEAALKNITSYFRAVFEAVVPLAEAILNASYEAYDSNQKAILKIPRYLLEDTIRRIHDEAHPILRSFLSAKAPSILMLLSKNTKLIFRTWDEMEARLEPNMKELRTRSQELLWKYFKMFNTSSFEYIHTYSLVEIQQDIESLYSLLPDVSKELLMKNWSMFQDVTGITTESVADLLQDVPGIFEMIEAIPFDQLMHFFLLLL